MDDEPVEGGSAADYMLEIGSKTFVPGIEDQLVGMEVDTDRTVVTTMPADYHAEQIAGKHPTEKVAAGAGCDREVEHLRSEDECAEHAHQDRL